MIITSVGLLVLALVLLVVGIAKSGVSYLIFSAIATLAAGGVLYASFIYYRNKAVAEGRLQVGPDGAVITPGYPTAYGAGVPATSSNGVRPAPSVASAFDGLTAKQAAEVVATLNLDELHEARRFEVEHENRRTVLRAVDARVDSIVSVRRSLAGAKRD